MDAMIHNMNRARYLAGSRPTHVTLFSHDLAHPDLECDDTECMVLEFDGAVAHLFITWAADLAVYSEEGNDREHIDIIYMVTDQGWRLTELADASGAFIRASRGGDVRDFRAEPLPETGYDAFARSVQTGEPLRRDLVTAREACEDVKLIRDAEHAPGVRLPVDLSLP
jgi:predicted dehydrogenase